jgi:hypothetical protein
MPGSIPGSPTIPDKMIVANVLAARALQQTGLFAEMTPVGSNKMAARP